LSVQYCSSQYKTSPHPLHRTFELQASGISISPIENKVFPTLSLRIFANPRASLPFLVLWTYRTNPW
jgi:hypothetical protein